MKSRHLVKVIVTSISGAVGSRLESKEGKGIALLKRGQSIDDFISDFMHTRGISSFNIYQRGDNSWSTSPAMMLDTPNRQVVTFNFTLFPEEDLAFYARDLSQEEIVRDVHPILKKLNKG
jgi:hypothetical protein